MTKLVKQGRFRALTASLALAWCFLLGGCATGLSGLECALIPPSISDTVDSFESSALAIQTANRILLYAPISEQESWPEKLFQGTSTEASVKMAISGIGAALGVTLPTEIDPETGFPRPTSPLYLMIQDRKQMLDRELKKTYVEYFRENPKFTVTEIADRQPDCTNEFAYKNPLMAFGTVSGNTAELVRLEEQFQQVSEGFTRCDAWVRRSQAGEVVQAYCQDPALKDQEFRTLEIRKTKEQLEIDRKAYGKLSKRVYQASIGGADFTAAAITKLGCAMIKFPQALQNAPKEFQGWKGAVNTAMLLPRLKNVFSAFGVYKNNLSLQFTAYKTMYTQLRSNYELKDSPQTKPLLSRIERFEKLYAELAPKFDALLAGGDVTFTISEVAAWERMAVSWEGAEGIALAKR